MKKILSTLIFMVFLLLVSCSPMAEKGLIGGEETCIYSNNGGSCSGYFEKVLGENIKSYDKVFLLDDKKVKLNLTVNSTDGEMSIGVKQFGMDEEWQTFGVIPGTPTTFNGWVVPDENGKLSIQFNQNQKIATGKVVYKIEFIR
ncbi:MAG: hypothetical protein ACYDH1_16665 [Anaerolineaceae bacterium]|jgi:hypothetical protein|nr:MAG: hypothetical protein CVU46_04750 [Chloroflexi bacterium HGW-Chloroflexi-8]